MMDGFPTVARLCGAALPAKPLDGLDILALLTGRSQQLDRDPLLYFNLWEVQCARWGKWKLHVASYNTAAYVPLPSNGLQNYSLPKPELYDLDRGHALDFSGTRSTGVRRVESASGRSVNSRGRVAKSQASVRIGFVSPFCAVAL